MSPTSTRMHSPSLAVARAVGSVAVATAAVPFLLVGGVYAAHAAILLVAATVLAGYAVRAARSPSPARAAEPIALWVVATLLTAHAVMVVLEGGSPVLAGLIVAGAAVLAAVTGRLRRVAPTHA